MRLCVVVCFMCCIIIFYICAYLLLLLYCYVYAVMRVSVFFAYPLGCLCSTIALVPVVLSHPRRQ